MTILFMGGEMPSFLPSDSNSYESTSLSGFASWETTYSRCNLRTINGTTDWVESQAWASQTSLYAHGVAQQNTVGTGSDSAILTLYNGSTAVVRLKKYTNDRFSLDYLNSGSVWTQAAIDTFNGNQQTWDVFVDVTNGILRGYVGGTKRLEATGLSLSHITGITKLRLNSNYYMAWSQVIAATVPTIGWKLHTVTLSGAGASSDWTGAYTAIDEIQYSDGDLISANTNDFTSTFALTLPTLTGFVVQAVGVYARAKKGASGPTNLQLVVRSGGTNYFSSSQALDVGYEPHGNIWETDPNTSAAWLAANVATIQAGVRAKT